MNQLDVYYRALTDYRAQTIMQRECVAQRNAIAKVNTESDRITVTRMICTVDEDWVNAIEEGLVHIEKAINEQRQFIRSNGEVVPIEKVKHVSKDSVEHLAKHSNLIARQTEGEDVIPDHLYTVERLSDFAVYENRFLYMLLCYLRDFITLRYNKILESSNTYDANMTMTKKIKINKRTISYDVSLAEIRKDDDYLRDHNEAKEIIDRIDLLLKAVLAFLATPLMEDCAKTPMLKPPITKTNVLKMNNNFKGAMNLYAYVTAYTKPGYTIETKVIELNPFREQLADEMAETVLLSSFLTYEYGLDIRELLQKSYEEEEARRKEEEYRRFLEKLEKARKRVQKMEMTLEEYILMLEKQNRILEDRCSALDAALEEIESLKSKLAEANSRIEELEIALAQVTEELEYQKKKYIEDIAALKKAHAEELQRLNEAHAEEIRLLCEEHAEEIRAITEAHAEEIRQLCEEHAEEIRVLMETHAEEIRLLRQEHAEEIRALNEAHAEEVKRLNEEIARINMEYEQRIEAINSAHAEEVARFEANLEAQREQMGEQAKKHELEKEQIREEFNKNIAGMVEKHKVELQRVNDVNSQQANDIADLINTREQMINEKRVLTAQLYALRVQNGVPASELDFTSQNNFDELEREFLAFKKFYRSEWDKTRKAIRKAEFRASKDRKKAGKK